MLVESLLHLFNIRNYCCCAGTLLGKGCVSLLLVAHWPADDLSFRILHLQRDRLFACMIYVPSLPLIHQQEGPSIMAWSCWRLLPVPEERFSCRRCLLRGQAPGFCLVPGDDPDCNKCCINEIELNWIMWLLAEGYSHDFRNSCICKPVLLSILMFLQCDLNDFFFGGGLFCPVLTQLHLGCESPSNTLISFRRLDPSFTPPHCGPLGVPEG